jgi:putative spermidine/putrescine transport system ATP-binding protein
MSEKLEEDVRSAAVAYPLVDPSAAETLPALELRGVRKKYGSTTAVDDIDLRLDAGEFLTLLGPSGSGKTTILRLVAGFTQPTSGAIIITGRDVSPLPPNRRDIGLVFQSYALFPHLTVEENIRFPLEARRWKGVSMRERLKEVITLVHLDGLEKRRPHELSGGQQQRVALARALAFRPSFLLMDEPLGALDKVLRAGIQDEIRRIHHETGATVLFVTHDREEALAMSTQIGVLKDGRLRQLGTVENVFDEPADEFVATLFGECNVFPVSGVRVTSTGTVEVRVFGEPTSVRGAPSTAQEESVVLLRPTRLSVVVADAREARGRGRVLDSQYLGELTRLVIHTDQYGPFVAVGATRELGVHRPGADVGLAFDDADLICARRDASVSRGVGEEA